MADVKVAKEMIAEIDRLQALTEEQRGDVEAQLTTLKNTMVNKVGKDKFAAFIDEFRSKNDLLAIAAMQEANPRTILQNTRADLISHYKAKGLQLGGRRRRHTRSKRNKRNKRHTRGRLHM